MTFERAKSLFFEGLGHHERHRFAEAEACYRDALALMPERVSILTNLAAVLVAQSRYTEAEALAVRALALEPGNPECQSTLAACRQALADPALRLAMQEAAVRTQPNVPLAHEALGATLLEQGEVERALDCFGRALRLAPESPSAAIAFARACESMGRHDDAIAACLDLLDRAPGATLVAQVAIALLLAHGLTTGGARDPRLQRLLVDGLKAPLANPQLLAPLVLADVRDALPDPALPDAQVVGALARLPVLGLLLARARNGDAALEALLVRARRHLLVAAMHANGAMPGAEVLDFCCALARQCWLNEHCWPCDAEEAAMVAALPARIGDGAVRDTTALLALASYAPVDGPLGADWRQRLSAMPPPVVAAIGEQCALAAEVRAAAVAIEVLTPIDDATSRAVRAQYEAHPYPRWTALPTDGLRNAFDEFVRRRIAGAPAVAMPDVDGRVQALNAGCGTGQHPVEMALRVDDLDLLAIDLSRNSLGHAAAMAARHGAGAIRFAQADLLALPALGRRFHFIESAGVLHHLAEPEAGLAALAACLAPRGLLRMALYSRAGRRGIAACRAWAAERGTGTDDASIRALRAAVLALAEDDPRRDPVRFADFYSTSECRDLLLHVQETEYDLPEVAGMLQRQGLRLLGLEVSPPALRLFRHEQPHAALDDPLAWHAFEQRHPRVFERMIVAWAQAPG